ncbi:hypothetical protein [Nonomuraea zeae]|uniref:SCP2 domain-containing protein n=1 Tax=Nonomuraea zeae TaxID=1642303 RepID=A0A5S4GX05_9ACTN|nr:hypothetical protein [Nonomuraea zeae]TMR37212.1 hypothetical protein ETD85_08795 [Nonomuraea zeae]
MTIFDERWVEAANKVLTGHRTGAVPQFRVVLSLRFADAAGGCWVVGENGTLRFSSTPVEPADIVATMPVALAREAFADGGQDAFITKVLSTPEVRIDGDFAKARFFLAGLVRNATPQTVHALRAIG